MAKILILGGGFGGVVTAEKLAASLPTDRHQITMVAHSRQFIFYPALGHLAFDNFKPDEISFDLQEKLAQIDVRLIEAEVIGIFPETREVRIAGADFNNRIQYDYLVIAIGRRLATEKVAGFFEHSHHILDVSAAQKFGAAVKNFREGNIIVGMCTGAQLPIPVCETAFTLAEKFKDEIGENRISINVVFPESIDKAFGGAKIYRNLDWAFAKHDIKLITDFAIQEITLDQVFGRGKQPMNHNLLMLVPPFEGQTIVNQLGDVSDYSGYAKVDSQMRVLGLSKTYAVGDIVALPGPKLAHLAVQQATVAATNILSEIAGAEPSAEYDHEIDLVIDSGDADSLHLHYGIWNEELYRLQTGVFWSWAKNIHDRYWQVVHS